MDVSGVSPIKLRKPIDLYGVKMGLGNNNPILVENINKIVGPEDYEDPELLKKRGYTSPPKRKDYDKVLKNSLVGNQPSGSHKINTKWIGKDGSPNKSGGGMSKSPPGKKGGIMKKSSPLVVTNKTKK